MVAIFGGGSVGLERSSITKLGSQGVLGDAVQGRSGDGVFVNAATGNLVIEKQDEFLVGLGPDVSIVRTYNSLGDVSDENGDNWRQSTDRRLEFDSTSNVFTRVSGDGTRITYSWDAARNAYVAKDGAGAHRLIEQYGVAGGSDVSLEVTETGAVETRQFTSGTEWSDPLQDVWDGEVAPAFDMIVKGATSWTWYDGNSGAVETYSTSGQLQRFADKDGKLLTYTYTGSQLSTITNSNGEWVKYTWNTTNNYVESVQTYTSATTATTRVFYTYDPSNRLSTVTVDLAPATTTSIGTTASPGSSVYTTTYTYDGSSKRVASITQSDGSSVTVDYDTSNRVKKLTQTVSAGTTRITSFNYDQLDLDAASVGYNKTYTAIDYTTGQSPTPVAGQDTRLYYDTNKNLIIAMSPLASAGASRQSVRFTYNSDGTLWKVTDALNKVTTFTDYKIPATSTEYVANGLPTTITDKLGNQTVRTYGSVLKVDATIGGVSYLAGTVFAYSATSPSSSYSDTSLFVRNLLLTETTSASDNGTAFGVSAAHTTRNVYDIEGHLRYAISAAGEVTEYRYSSAGQVLTEIGYPEQTFDVTSLVSTASPTETQMNAWRDGLADRSSTEIAKYAYDLRGGLLNTIKYGIASAAGSASTSNGTTQYNFVYDQDGRLLSRVDGDPAAAVPQTATTYLYDGMGRVISTTSADGGVTTVSFQDKSSTTVVTLASGLVQTSVYNLAGDLIAQTDNQAPVAGNVVEALTSWTGANLNAPTASTAINGQAAYLYTVTGSGTLAYTRSGLQPVKAGQTVTFEITLKETTGNTAINRLGISGSASGWGADAQSAAMIVSGPGTLSQSTGGLFSVQGLSSTQATVIRVTRVVTTDESMRAAVYLGSSASATVAGDQVILSAPKVTIEYKRTSLYDELGRTRVAYDALGNASYAVYDDAGRKTGDVAADGSLTEYRYDAGNQLIATVRYAGRVSAAKLASATDTNTLSNPLNTLTIADIRPVAAAGDEWAWKIYDGAGRVVQTIGGDGANTRLDYDAGGNLVRQTRYFDRFNAATLSGFKSALPTAIVGISSTNSDYVNSGAYNQTRSFYDQQGRLIGSMDHYGGISEIVYDEAGRKIDEVHYEKLAQASFTNGLGTAVSRTSASFADIRANVVAQGGADRHTRTVYDGEVLRYVIDALGYVSQYDYDTTGAGTTVTRYLNALPGTTTDYTFDNVKLQLAALASSASDRKTYNVLNAKGQVAYTIDGENAVTGFAYNTSGAVIRSTWYSTLWTPSAARLVTDLDAWAASTPVGTTTTIALAADNRITRSFYDTRAQLVYAVDGEGYVTETSYDEEGRVTAVTRYDHAISGLTDGSSLANVNSKVTADRTAAAYSRTQTAYDALGRVSDITDAVGNVTHYDYYATGEVWKETKAYGALNPDGSSAAVATTYTYDPAGRVASKTDAAGTSVAATTSYTYDGLGNVTSVTDPGLNVTYNYYDRMGRLTSTRDAEDYVTRTTYTSFGEVAGVTRYANKTTTTDVSIAPAVTASSSLDASSYSYYDKLGRVIWTRDAENYVTGTTYTSLGQVWKVTRYATALAAGTSVAAVPSPTLSATADATTTFDYDRLGRLLKTTDAELKFESQTYNAFGQIDTKTNKLGGVTSYTYNKRGLLIKENAPAPLAVDGTQPAGGIDTVYTYDANGNRLTMTEAGIRTTTYGYDRNNRLISVSGTAVPVLYLNAGALTEATGTTATTTRYDSLGNVIETLVQSTIGTTTTTLSRTLAWYDRLGRKSDEFKTGSAIGKGSLSHWEYYASGTVSSMSVRGTEVSLGATAARPASPPDLTTDIRTTSYAYDKLDRLKTTSVDNVLFGSYSGSSYSYKTLTVATTNYYDAAGNLIRQTDGRGDNTYFYYDRLNRKTAQVDRENYLTAWTLDEDGNTVDEVRYANVVIGTVTTAAAPLAKAPGSTSLPPLYVFTDAANDRSTHFTYDRMGRRLTEERAGVLATTVNATSGAKTTSNTTAVITYTYNGLGEVTSKKEATGDKTVYDYDSMGRMAKETDLPVGSYNAATGAILDLTNAPVTQFWYDGLGNLTRSDENGRVTQYQYYASGKLKALTNADSVTRTYYYDGAGNKVAEKYLRTGADSTATASSVYDAMTYTYDAAGRLTAQGYATVTGTTWAAAANSDTTSMGYNAYGEVIGRGINLTSAQIAAGAYQDKFDYDNAGHMWRSTAGDGTVNLYVYDENGNQTLDITSSGAVLANNQVWSNPTGTQTQLDMNAVLNLLTATTTAGVSTLKASAIQGIVTTMYKFDGRNQQITTLMPNRETTAIGSYSATPLYTDKTYNAFGEVASETDARRNTTNYTYNTLGRVTKRELPAVNWTAENGDNTSASQTARPTENYFYDISGRVVGVQDANGNVNTRTLLAGTGYGKDSEALVLKEFHADTGVFERQYDLHHDMRVTINEVGKTESYSYDALGQLTEQDHQIRTANSPGNDTATAVQLKDFYDYDNLGHRTLHWNSQYATLVGATLTPTVTETTAYDIQGRVTSQVDLGGDTTSYSYAWDGALVTSGLGTFGGWSKVTTNSSGKTRTDKTDYFGHTVDMIDYGGHNYDYAFDLSGRLITRSNIALNETITWSYYNTGMMQSQQSSYGTTYYGSIITATYQYDADNHRTFEGYEGTTTSTNFWTGATTSNAAIRHQHAYVTWDAAGRMTSLADSGHSDDNTVNGYGPVQINWEYDLGGNIRHMVAAYRSIDSQGAVSATATTQDYWYRYDAMNRFVTTKGLLVVTDSSGYVLTNASGQQLVGDLARGNANAKIRSNYLLPIPSGSVGTGNGVGQGHEIEWDKSGSRVKDTTYSYTVQTERTTGQGVPLPDYYSASTNSEVYTYSYDGYVSAVSINGTVRSRFTRDAMGRVTDYREYSSSGYVSTNPDTNVVYQRNATYNGKSLVLSDIVKSVQGADTFVNTTTYYYNADATGKGVTSGGTYMGGAVTLSSTAVTKNGTSQTGSTTTNTLVWWGGTMQSLTNYDSGSTHNTSTFNYDQSGHLQSVYIQDGRPRTISFVTDVNGQILARQESDNRTSTNLNGATDAAFTGDPKEIHYYFNGMGVGDISNNGTSDVDYVTGIAQHTAVAPSNPGAFRGGGVIATPYADFDQSYDPINGLNYASTSSRYVVQGGDTLSSIAQAVWGDASFWYMIADANGLDGTETLVAGQSLILPNKVHNSHNNTSTYRVYDPNEAIGDTAPTAVAPPKKGNNNCGFFGAIMRLLITIVVKAVLAPLQAIPVIGPAITSIVSQGISTLVGLQDHIDWKQVGMTALQSGVDKGIDILGGAGGAVGKVGGFLGSDKLINKAIRSAVTSGVSQGIGVAIGLQDEFSWGGVAGAALGSIAGDKVGGWGEKLFHSRDVGEKIGSGAFAIVDAATRSLIDGTDFGDNIIAVLPDVIVHSTGLDRFANTIGNLAADGIASLDRNAHAAELLKEIAPNGATLEQRQHVKDMLKAGVPDTDIRNLYAQGLGVGQGSALASSVNSTTVADFSDVANNPSSPLKAVEPIRVVDGLVVDENFVTNVAQKALSRGNVGIVNLLDEQGGAHGGHAMSHVGLSDAQLRAWMAPIKTPYGTIYKSAHSTFSSLKSANSLVSVTLNANENEIIAYLASGSKKNFVVHSSFANEFTGTVYYRPPALWGVGNIIGMPGKLQIGNGRGVTVVIRRNDAMPRGYGIVTAYPTLYPQGGY